MSLRGNLAARATRSIRGRPEALPILTVLAAAALAMPAPRSIGLPAAAHADPLAPELLEAGDPAWRDLERLELAGLLPLGATALRPASRGEVATWVAQASAEMAHAAALRGTESAGGPSAARADRHALERLERAFARELRRLGAPRGNGPRETPPLLRLRDEGAEDPLPLDGARSELRIGPTLAIQPRATSETSELGDSTRAGVYGVFLVGRSVALQGELYAGEVEGGRGIGDPLIHGTDVLYFLDEASAAIANREVRARIARGRHRWGAGRGPALLLDEGAAPFSFLEYELRLPARIGFRSWVGSLNAFEERGIAAHRLTVPLHRDLTVAIAEGVRYKGGIDHPLYLIGLLPYTLVQRFDDQDASDPALRPRQRNNVLAEAEILWRPRPGALAHLELLVDDLPAENADAPARGGARLGFALLPMLSGEPIELRLEGTKIGRYTYAVDYDGTCECDWAHQERGLGDPGGPDQETLRLWVGRSFGRDHHLELHGLLENHGSGSLGEAWPDSLAGISEPTRRAFTVSGPVRRERAFDLTWRWEPRDNLAIETIAALSWVRDPGGAGAADGYEDRWSLSAWARWRR